MTKTWHVGGRHHSETIIRMYLKKKTIKLRNLLKLSRVVAVFVVETNHKLLLSK